ncbi:LamG domain-containing protein [Streptomyces verrucosisporus]|uniref:LamG domain-containing protein n=1 Tax=Streptomyces verrucosisporus TaxID=1695161 RepID=UPI001F127E0B|nr:laminin G domain-containing protein [Streptomyces verrucosisporus]
MAPISLAQATTVTEDSPALSEGQQALAEAQQSGQRVEVTSERSERTTVFANPDGFTFTLEESSVPVRVATPDGGWQAPDPTLEARADGTVGPKASAAEMVFSGGGDNDPLAKITNRGRSLELGWPGNLPEPELDGTSALYREVLPDVDLQVTASTEGFRHLLLVKTPEAAASPELERIDYTLETSELTVREGSAGNLAAVDADGKTVFRAPPAQMWDSAGAAGEQQTTPSGAALQSAATTEGSVDAASSGEAEPGPGDTVTRMDVEVTQDTLTVVPDPEMLTATAPEAFPLYIDPTVTWGESERTLLRNDGYESYGWGNGSDGMGKGVGKCGSWNGYYCGPGYVQRLYFEFSPASLKGKKVLDATFRVTEPWAFQCDPRWVDLVRTKDNISSSTTWASRPMGWDLMVDRYVSAGRGSLCDPDSPDAPIEFNDNPDESNENLTPTVRDFAAGKFSRLTLMIKAHDETDTSAWKRFKNDAVLAVDYVGLPAKPTNIGVASGSGTVCEKDASDPAVISDPTPALKATTQTASGGENEAQLRIYFDIDHQNGDGTWSDTPPVGISQLSPSTGYVGDNRALTRSWSTLTEGTLYRYRAWVRSYYNSGNSYLSGPSNASTTGWCYFTVDPTAPKPPTVAIGSPYTECTPNDCAAHGGPGVETTLTFGPAEGDSNTAYQYKISAEGTWSAKLNGATASPKITPTRSGTYRVYVKAFDELGRDGETNVVDFLVKAGDAPVGRWHFDEASGAAVDSGTGGGAAQHDATLYGGAARDDRGRRGVITHDTDGVPLETPVTDRGLALNGTSAYAATAGPVLETRSGYTFSTWVRLDDKDATGVILSQDGQNYSPFVLTYEKPYDTWYFGVKEKDEDTGSAYWGKAALKPATVGAWTHLAGTYNPADNKLKLYVNGQLQGTASSAGSWSSNGGLQIGRYKWAGNYQKFFSGSIDEVTVWQRVLSDEEIADDARLMISKGHAGVELVAHWDPSTGSGTTVADTTSGYGRSLALTGGALLDGEAIVLDGVDDAASATGPLVDDTGSFTVTTKVELDGADILAKPVGYIGQVLGQRTADGSAWGLWYQLTDKKTVLDEETFEEHTVPVGNWHFGRLNTDGTFSSVPSAEAAALDSEVRLTGIFDAQAGQISLYLGYNQNRDAREFTAKVGSGDFVVGRGFTSGTWQHHLPGRITDVRLWAGAMAGHGQMEARVGD